MKFSIEKAEFLKALHRVQGIVERRNTMPILSNCLIEAKGASVYISATDLEVFIKDSARASVTEEGAITVSAKKLFEIVKEMPEDHIGISSGKDDKFTIKSGKARFNIMGIAVKDFPSFPSFDPSTLEDLDGAVFREMINKTSFAVSTDETRYNINGFKLEREGSKIRLITTDGHRLALIERGAETGASTEKVDALLPRKGVMEFKRLLDEETGGYKLSITPKNAVMTRGETVINVRLLEGEFPDYKKVIPNDNDKEISAVKSVLLSSLRRVSILSPDKIKGVRMTFGNGRLVISSSSPDIGEATEEIDVEYGGEELDVSFNARYFVDALEAMEEDSARIRLKDSMSPGILQPNVPNGENYTCIIMPMRL